jgi:demethylmenaquinone methyltransferase/2-methoxy-6-polyprenyl-1,4-benzoquinol methylase
MVWSLEYGKRVYDWWSRHPLGYSVLMWSVTFGKEKEFRRRVVESVSVSEGDTVVDLACGSGRNLELLSQAVGDTGTVVGIDYSKGMVRRAKKNIEKRGIENAYLIRADAADEVIAEASVDGVVCTMSLSAIPDHDSAVENIRRCLRPGGRLAVMDSSELEGPLRFLNPVTRILFKYTTNWDYRKDVLGSMAEQFGQENVTADWDNSGSIYFAVGKKPNR